MAEPRTGVVDEREAAARWMDVQAAAEEDRYLARYYDLAAASLRQPVPAVAGIAQVVEACARVCEKRASSLANQRDFNGEPIPRWSEAGEARKCATAIRSGWRAELEASPAGDAAEAREG